MMNGGVFVYVPKNVEINEPIQTLFWQEDKEVALFNHVIVVAEENSSVTYVENYISDNDSEETVANRSEEHTSELQSRFDLVCRLLLEKKNKNKETDSK